MKSLTVKVEDRLYRKLDRLVRKRGYTKNGFIVALLEQALRRPRGITGVSIHAGHPFWELVGSVRGQPADVSENVDAYLYGGRR